MISTPKAGEKQWPCEQFDGAPTVKTMPTIALLLFLAGDASTYYYELSTVSTALYFKNIRAEYFIVVFGGEAFQFLMNSRQSRKYTRTQL